ncbi:MAG TPA: hypothetical protein VF765_13120 [Polyangiaceae bacterium]
MRRLGPLLLSSALAACASSQGGPLRPAAGPAPGDARLAREQAAAFAQVEDEALGWLMAADPRMAARANASAPAELLARIGTDAVLAEDTTAVIRGGSLDLFAFRARARALSAAAERLATFHGDLPEAGPVGSALARPRLERELLDRLVAEETARADEESKLGEASGDLVRAMVTLWQAPKSPQEVPEVDAWAAKHLLEIRDSLHGVQPRNGPRDLDVALYPLEHLLAPPEFPKGAAAIAQVRMAIDDDRRVVPRVESADSLARAVKTHLGLDVAPATLAERLSLLGTKLREDADRELASLGETERAAALARARQLLLVERACPGVPDSRVRDMAPPPERAAACGVLHLLIEEPSRAAVAVALHDDVLLSMAAVTSVPPPRTKLLSRPEDDDVDAFQRAARERPVVALGAALAIEMVTSHGNVEQRVAAWHELGEAPLDVVERELDAAR